MPNRIFCLACVFLGLTAWLGSNLVLASGAILTTDEPWNPAEDQILVQYDPATKQEKITFGSIIRFRGEHFAFLVPLPAEAKVEPASAQLFLRLTDYVSQPVQTQVIRHWEAGSLIWHLLKSLRTAPQNELPTGDAASQTTEKSLVARRTAQIRLAKLQTDSSENLLKSLKDELNQENPLLDARGLPQVRNFTLPETFTAWVKNYHEKKFVWHVFMARTDLVEAESQMDEQVLIQPFSLTFTTETPFIPLVIPVGGSPQNWKTKHVFRYFVAAQQRSEISVAGQPLFKPTETVFADRVSQEDWRSKIFSPVLPNSSATGNPKTTTAAVPSQTSASDIFLTAFVRTDPTPPPFTEDGTIKPAANQTTIRPQTKIVQQHQTVTIPIEAALLIGGGVLAMLKQKKKD
ncbi:MAG: DUF2330 domain-containing protein [Blastocatellia bacterium]|nr:DUF2330 domain-containing protein [Blastocatellia bacterium]